MKTSLPDYHVRRSAKSKSLRLKVTQEGLCVVVPRGFDEDKIPAVLQRKKLWIADAMKRVGEAKRFFEPESAKHLPERVTLTALGETWPVLYKENSIRKGLSLRVENGEIIISGAAVSREDAVRKLKHWLRLRVREVLFPLAENLATKHRMKLGGLLVKSQRTRWASCSARGNLSLNTKLLFLPPDLVRYVLLHELCHTVHMNHSGDFWRLLASHETRYKLLDTSMRDAWKRVPQWMF
jgi:predicted metal-dependent hydrolase